MPPVLVFARTAALLARPAAAAGERTLLEVSANARSAVERMLGGAEGRLGASDVDALRAVRAANPYDADLDLLVAMIVRDGEAFVRFL